MWFLQNKLIKKLCPQNTAKQFPSPRVRCGHLAPRLRVPDLPDGRVELDVEAVGQRDGHAGVAVANRQVAAGEGESVVLHTRNIVYFK